MSALPSQSNVSSLISTDETSDKGGTEIDFVYLSDTKNSTLKGSVTWIRPRAHKENPTVIARRSSAPVKMSRSQSTKITSVAKETVTSKKVRVGPSV